MKKLFLIFSFILISFLTYSQNFPQFKSNLNSNESGYIEFVDQQPWIIENDDSWGSFYWKVIRTEEKIDGDYWYFIYFYSNSLLRKKGPNNTNKAITYISDLNIKMIEISMYGIFNVVNTSLQYITCDYDSENYKTFFYSKSKLNSFKITYDEVTPYDYSKK